MMPFVSSISFNNKTLIQIGNHLWIQLIGAMPIMNAMAIVFSNNSHSFLTLDLLIFFSLQPKFCLFFFLYVYHVSGLQNNSSSLKRHFSIFYYILYCSKTEKEKKFFLFQPAFSLDFWTLPLDFLTFSLDFGTCTL